MTVLSRGARTRRSGRRPGWLLLTVLLVLAIAASSALVFTNRIELLKLAVILALWAAVVAAFVSVIYRRQSDADQAKVRDLKLVYDLQLDREISARREYELTVETHLRRELSSELRAQAADEVAALRAELAALRTSLEILFDTDLAHRPAIEPERAHSEWLRGPEQVRPDRVASSRITEVRDEDATPTAESPIIDVPEEPLVPPPPPPPPRRPVEEPDYRGSHRQAAEETTYIPQVRVDVEPPPPPMPPQDWQPPANWAPVPPHATENGHVYDYPQEYPPEPPLVQEPLVEEPRGRHSGQPEPALFVPPPPPPPEPQPEPRGRHSVPGAAPAMQAPPAPEPPPAAPAPEPPSRHGGADDDGPATGGHSAAELLARFQTVPGGGGRRRRRED